MDPLWQQCEPHRRLLKPRWIKTNASLSAMEGEEDLENYVDALWTDVPDDVAPSFSSLVMAGTVNVRLALGGQLPRSFTSIEWLGSGRTLNNCGGCLLVEMKGSWRLVSIPLTGESVLEGQLWRWFPRREELCSTQHKLTNISLCNLIDCYLLYADPCFTYSYCFSPRPDLSFL